MSKKTRYAILLVFGLILILSSALVMVQQSVLGSDASFTYKFGMEYGQINCGVEGCVLSNEVPSLMTPALVSGDFFFKPKARIGDDVRGSVAVDTSFGSFTLKEGVKTKIQDNVEVRYSVEKLDVSMNSKGVSVFGDFVLSFEFFINSKDGLKVSLKEAVNPLFKDSVIAVYVVDNELGTKYSGGVSFNDYSGSFFIGSKIVEVKKDLVSGNNLFEHDIKTSDLGKVKQGVSSFVEFSVKGGVNDARGNVLYAVDRKYRAINELGLLQVFDVKPELRDDSGVLPSRLQGEKNIPVNGSVEKVSFADGIIQKGLNSLWLWVFLGLFLVFLVIWLVMNRGKK